MARRPTYRQKLQDPRWQKKRLEVMNRADWRCEWCGTDATSGRTRGLQVHHGWYGRDVEPWEYELEVLYCLCDGCHEAAETVLRVARCELARIHPRHHEHVVELLRQVQDVIADDESLLKKTNVERG